MFEFLKKEPTTDAIKHKLSIITKQVEVIPEANNVNDLIDEIHETFYTEVDRLLNEAKITHSLETDKAQSLEKAKKLKLLGFSNSKTVKEAKNEEKRIESLEQQNQEKQILLAAINYFSQKYPQYKFITEDSVKKICGKYNLVYGEAFKYIGDVPDKNLKDIENFRIDEIDECFSIEYEVFEKKSSNSFDMMHKKFISAKEKNNSLFKKELLKDVLEAWCVSDKEKIRYDIAIGNQQKLPFEIAAPIKDFNMSRSQIKDHKVSEIEIPDPVVLKPVLFNNRKYYLIVTAWGQEASDELVVNERHN